MKNRHIVLGSLIASMFLALLGPAPVAQAGYLSVYGGPTVDTETFEGIYADAGLVAGVNNGGTAAGGAWYDGSSEYGFRGARWDTTGAAVVLGHLGTDGDGGTNSCAYGVNYTGLAVGSADKYDSGSDFLGWRAVRWNASGTTATELGNLGTDSDGYTESEANAVNYAGMIVGYATKYVNGNSKGNRAVRWDASGTAATELGNIGVNNNNSTNAYANAVNDAGTAVGYAEKRVSTTNYGFRAVRWDASGTATELGNIGENGSGVTNAYAKAVNYAGTAVGYATTYVGGVAKGNRAVRWDASGTAATELACLGTNGSSVTEARATAMNDAGTAVGYATKYVSGVSMGN